MFTFIYMTLQQTPEMKTIGFHKITVTKFRSISFTNKTVNPLFIHVPFSTFKHNIFPDKYLS